MSKQVEKIFTAVQIADWKRYEKVRKSGRHNMFFPEARRATGLDAERYSFVIKHFAALKTAAESVGPNEKLSGCEAVRSNAG